MIVGNGLIASGFKNLDREDLIIFASGVSNSSEINADEFNREQDLLIHYMREFPDKKLIYFNSILSSEDVESYYFMHKRKMVSLIHGMAKNYKIYNIPQIFGPIGNPTNIVNLFIDHIKKDNLIIIQEKTFRSIIDIEDLANIVAKTWDSNKITINIAHIELVSVKRLMDIIAHIYGKNPKWIFGLKGVSINRSNDPIVDGAILDLGIEKMNYTERTIRKYVK